MMTIDVVDHILGLTGSPDLAALRGQRADIRRLTESSYEAALHPGEPRNFSYAERAALAGRMARLWKSHELAAHYDGVLHKQDGDAASLRISDPENPLDGATDRLKAIIRHVDLVTLTPRQAEKSDIGLLYAAGLDDRDIVTLAGLIAFVNYQILVMAGLRMLRDN
ncbi:CMD domain protein [Phyllobacterium sp. SB3]|uniref:CMD domain protein n=1 Tax=Phyllobacterium sp. SB3 TaxID=3156073 RepID=UPI0032AED8CE